MAESRNARVYLISSVLFFTFAQACVKLIPSLPVHEIVFLRSLISGAMTYYFIKRAGISPLGVNRPMLLFRGLLGATAMLLYFWTIQSIPLASAMTLHYLYPLFTVLFAAFFLREKTRPLQWACLFLSFVGVCLIKGFDPRIGIFSLAVAIVSALFDSGTFTIVRALRSEDHALVVVFYLPLVSIAGLAPYTLTHFVWPTNPQILAILAIGLFAQIGQYCVTRAYQLDQASNIANLNYLAPLGALALGYFVWNETISPLAVLGIITIVLSAVLSTGNKRIFERLKIVLEKRRVRVDPSTRSAL